MLQRSRKKRPEEPDTCACRANWHLLSERKRKLIIGISKGDVNTVEKLMIKDDLKHPMYDGKSALLVAATNTADNVKEMFEYLLNGFPERDRDGSTALHFCSAQGNLVGMKAYLELQPFSHSQQSYDGSTPLGLAAQNGNLEGVKLLLKYGADPAQPSINSASPLVLAAATGHVTVVEYLLNECHVSPEEPDADGRTPLHVASIDNRLEIAIMLLERGVNVDAMTRTGMTPLMIACQYGHRDLVKLFVKEFCDSELSTKTGTTALCFAAMHGHVKIVKYLLKAGANLDDGSPLLFACQEGRLFHAIFSIKIRGYLTDLIVLINRSLGCCKSIKLPSIDRCEMGRQKKAKRFFSCCGMWSLSITKNAGKERC